MKKFILLIAMLLIFTGAVSAMVDSTSAPVWKISADTPNQAFIKADLMTRSIAFNRLTDHLLVATRTGGARIVILNAATGDSVGIMDTASLTGGTYVLNKVTVAEDGAVYGCNLNTGSGFKIYRWADENAAPTLAADTTITGVTRYGDALNVIGSGLNTKIFISGNNAGSRITILGTSDGSKFTVEKVVPRNGQALDISPVDLNTYWTNYSGANARLVNGDGDIVGQVPLSEIPSNASALVHFGYAGHWYLGCADGSLVPASGRLLQLGDTPADAKLRAVFRGMGSNTNTSGAGGVAVDVETSRMWILTTNNSIALYPFGGYAIFPLVWRHRAASTPWIGTEDGVRSLAYNQKTRHLYVATTSGARAIRVINPANGATVGELSLVGMDSAPLTVNRITTTPDGQIFVANLAEANGLFRLYRYANEEAPPMLIYAGAVPARTGDALASCGIGGGVTLFASGTGNDKILTFTVGENSMAVRGSDIPLPEVSAAAMGISPVEGGEYLFTSAPGQPVRYIKRDGTLLTTFEASELSGTSAQYVEIPTLIGIEHKFLMVAQGHTPGVRVIELLGEEGENLCIYWENTLTPAMSPVYASNPNLTGLSQVVYDIHTNQMIELCSNNGLSAYSFLNVTPEAGLLEPVAVLSPETLDFGQLYIGQRATRSLVIKNTGTAPLNITGTAFGGDQFNADLQPPHEVGVQDSITVHITLEPLRTGELLDAFTLLSNVGVHEVLLKAVVDEFWPLVWRQTADTTAWHGTAGMLRSLAFNKVTRHLIAVSRVGGNLLKLLDPGTGKVVGEMNTTGIDGGALNINMVAVTDDGQIFAGNLAMPGQNFQLYYWASEDGVPVKVFDAPLDGRTGDALAVQGSGQVLTILVSGLENDKIFSIGTSNGISFSRGGEIPLPAAGAAAYAISPAGSSHLFITGPEQMVRYIKNDGTLLHTFNLEELQGTTCTYFAGVTDADVTRHFLTVSDGYAPGTRLIELTGAEGDSLCAASIVMPVATPTYSTTENSDGYGQVVYDRVNNQLIELATNNGISAYSFVTVLANPKSWIILTPIAEAKKDLDGDFKPDLIDSVVTISGVITTLNYNTGNQSNYFLQDDEGWGINLFSPSTNYPLEIGDRVMVTGKIAFYNGLTEVIATGLENVTVLEKGLSVTPVEVTGDELNERTEGTLVRISGYYLSPATPWPAAGKNATLKFIRGADTVLVFIDKETDIDGSPAPVGYWAITGVVDQFTRSVPPNDGYEVRPRSLADLTQMTGVAMENRELPTSFALHQNYPNPFNPVTTIGFDVPQEGEYRIAVFDLLGNIVATIHEGKLNAGFHRFEFDGRQLSSGVYFYRVESAGYVDMKKMTLLK